MPTHGARCDVLVAPTSGDNLRRTRPFSLPHPCGTRRVARGRMRSSLLLLPSTIALLLAGSGCSRTGNLVANTALVAYGIATLDSGPPRARVTEEDDLDRDLDDDVRTQEALAHVPLLVPPPPAPVVVPTRFDSSAGRTAPSPASTSSPARRRGSRPATVASPSPSPPTVRPVAWPSRCPPARRPRRPRRTRASRRRSAPFASRPSTAPR